MSKLFNKNAVFSSILAATAVATAAHAAQPQAGFTVTPNIGYTNTDGDRNINDDSTYGIGLGYQFDSPWAIEFNYLNADSELSNGQDVDADQYRLDGLYHFVNESNFTPYVAAGLGATNYSDNVDGDGNTQFNAGGGIKYAMTNNLALRADYRVLEDLEDDYTDQVATLGLQMTFGGSDKSATQVVATNDTEITQVEEEPVQEVVEPTPEPVITQIEPEPEPEPVQPTRTVLPYNVEFAFDSAAVSQSSYPEIQEIAAHLNAHPDQIAQIQGYSDGTGKPEYNLELSEKRAKSVADVLVEDFGISSDRIETIGYGEQNPLVANTTQENRALNRRVTTVVFGTRDDFEMLTAR
ncbi:OmpA family protein [Rhodanobacter aciditrophus]|uniref:OmpA family protein n=1 Tax=Rhodanobacter aciditrophus TaxID=1623218 RepID=A0ABW4B0K6_9GAMM